MVNQYVRFTSFGVNNRVLCEHRIFCTYNWMTNKYQNTVLKGTENKPSGNNMTSRVITPLTLLRP